MLQTSGIRIKACGWSSLYGTNSATIVLMMPTLPLPAPDSALTAIAIGTLVEKPQTKLVIMVLVSPSNITGFLPNLSEARPQAMPVKHWENEKTADVIPAHFATSFLGTLKLSIISGRYGKTDVKATGSAKRHIAGLFNQISFEVIDIDPNVLPQRTEFSNLE